MRVLWLYALGLLLAAAVPARAQDGADPVLIAKGRAPIPICTDDPRIPAILDSLAARSGATRSQLRVDPALRRLEGTATGGLRLVDYVLEEPERAPGTLEAIVREVLDAETVDRRIGLLARLGRPEARTPATAPPAVPEREQVLTSSDPVVEALGRLFGGTGDRFQGNDRETVRREAAQLPAVVQREVAALILDVTDAIAVRHAVLETSAFRGTGIFGGKAKRNAESMRAFLSEWWSPERATEEGPAFIAESMGSVDRDGLYAGARALARGLERSAIAMPRTTSEPFQFDWNTPYGWISVGGSGRNEYDQRHVLVVDLGGDDTYRGCGAVSGDEPVSVVLDMGGVDTYAPADSGRAGPGGAILGFAAVRDCGTGNDTYTAPAWGCGFGFLGVGWIEDEGGDDRYLNAWLGTGAGFFGMGMLVDRAGKDYSGWNELPKLSAHGRVQGFAGPGGFGVMLDLGGDDTYSATENAQGSATGTGRELAGGMGLLADAAGNDIYVARDTSRSSSQGAGMGDGLGVLFDAAGDDEYIGNFGKGYGMQGGVGLLLDLAGMDAYLGSHALGLGDNLGMGIFWDVAGDDLYEMGPQTAGVSLRHGMGWFLDLGGMDTFSRESVEPVIAHVDPGETEAWRARVPGVAIHINLDDTGPIQFAPPSGTGPRIGGRAVSHRGVLGTGAGSNDRN